MVPVRFQVVKKGSQEEVREIHKVVVHRFVISDTDDPEIYAVEPIMNWQASEPGKFVMEHSVTVPVFHKQLDHLTYNYQYAITAEFEKRKYSEFLLRFGRYGNHQS